MFGIKILAIALLALIWFSGGPSSGCRSQSTNSKTDKTMPPPTESNSISELKVLAEGGHSPVETSFVAVIRDSETYSALRNVAGNLPELAPDFFKSNIVIAAFLGTRNTGGYSVQINRAADGQIRVTEEAPGKDAMVTQVITSPFKIVSVATTGTPAVSLLIEKRLEAHAQLYRVNSGTFSVSGGIAGRTQTFQLEGKLQVTRLGDLITIGFALVGKDTSRERVLKDSATGLVKNNEIVITRLSRGSLVDFPSGDLRISGRFAEKNNMLLNLVSDPITAVSDGYSGKGTIEAQMVAVTAN